jgi:hypothetical protein
MSAFKVDILGVADLQWTTLVIVHNYLIHCNILVQGVVVDLWSEFIRRARSRPPRVYLTVFGSSAMA